jgi:DNA-binding beta-propeller fold protein YncE
MSKRQTLSMPERRRGEVGRRKLLGLCVISAAAVVFLLPALAKADSIYWSTTSAIRTGNLNGSASGAATNVFTGETGPAGPQGVAIDSAAGKIYWANFNTNSIRVGNLDGSGTATNLFTAESGPEGVAIDPAAGKIYWANATNGTIRVANLNGTGSPVNLFTGEGTPVGLAIDPGAGKIYWANAAGAIRVANLNGTGTAADLFSGEDNPQGLAIDSAAGKIYWASAGATNAIRVGNLTGGTATNLFPGETTPLGVAVDPSGDKIYWARPSAGAIRVGPLAGGTAANLFTGETGPHFPAVLRTPQGTGLPKVSGGTVVGSKLTCLPATWAPDLLGSFLYRAPQTIVYSWTKDGSAFDGNSRSITAKLPGKYTCTNTAINHAGAANQQSAPVTVRGCVVPKLKGKRIKPAKKSLRRADCKLGKVKGPRSGKVKKQKPKPGKVLAPGAKVKLTLR